MNSDSLRAALEALEPQAQEAQAEVARLEHELRIAKDQAQRLSVVVDNLMSLAGEPLSDQLAITDSVDVERTTSTPLDFAWSAVDIKHKVPSATQLVTEAVVTAGRPTHRVEVYRDLSRRGLTAAMSKPSNNINVALRRAAEQGRIVDLGNGRYAPPGWNHELPDDLRTGSRDEGPLIPVGGDHA